MAGFEPTTLRTDRLVLRPPGKGDADDHLAAVDEEIRRWMAWSADFTRDKALRWCTDGAFRDSARELNLVIAPKDSGRFAGMIGISRTDWETGVAEAGYWLGPAARRRGYVTEALRAVAAHAFGLGLYRLELVADSRNVASLRVAERAGFTREGVLRKARPVPGGRIDLVLFSLLEGEL